MQHSHSQSLLFDSTSKPYSKSMIEDVAIEMLRMELHDEESYKINLPFVTYTNTELEKDHYMMQLQKQKLNDLSNQTENQFTRWEDMKELRDERFDRLDKVRMYKQHQHAWPVYKYGYEKAMNLNSGLVYLKTPKLEQSIRSQINSADVEKKVCIEKKKKKKKTVVATNNSNIRNSQGTNEIPTALLEQPALVVSPSSKDKISEIGNQASGIIENVSSAATQASILKVEIPTPTLNRRNSSELLRFDDSLSLPSLYLSGSPSLAIANQQSAQHQTAAVVGMESNYCTIKKFFADNNDIQSSQHQPTMHMGGMYHQSSQKTRASFSQPSMHLNKYQRQQMMQEPYYFVKRKTEEQLYPRAPTIRLLPIDANMYFLDAATGNGTDTIDNKPRARR